MTTITEAPKDPEALLSEIRAKSKLIRNLRVRRDKREFKSVGDAIALQKAERERKKLQAQLPPLRMVTD
jgi:hypothetical protein